MWSVDQSCITRITLYVGTLPIAARTMVNGESCVLPSPAGSSDGEIEEGLRLDARLAVESEPSEDPMDDTLDSMSASRPSRPHFDNGYADEDHYFKDDRPVGRTGRGPLTHRERIEMNPQVYPIKFGAIHCSLVINGDPEPISGVR